MPIYGDARKRFEEMGMGEGGGGEEHGLQNNCLCVRTVQCSEKMNALKWNVFLTK